MVNLLGLVLVVQSVGSLRRKGDNSTAGSVHTNHQLVNVTTDPDEDTRRARLEQSNVCYDALRTILPSLIENLPSLPCPILKNIRALIKANLKEQGVQAAVDVLTLGLMTGINEFAEVGSLLREAVSPERAIPVMLTVQELADRSILARDSSAEAEIMQLCCPCDASVDQCKQTQCYTFALEIYEKVTKKHPVVKSATKISSRIAMGAAVVGIVADVASVGSTGGAGVAAAGTASMSLGVTKNLLTVGHLAASCLQRDVLKICYKDMCKGEGTG